MKHIKAYDALRGLCIISILISHLGLYHILPDNDFLKERVWLVISGWAGITIFFTLSGFLITLLLFSDQSQSRFVRIKNFYMRRIIRIFPPLIIFQTTIAILIHYNLIESTALGYYFSVFFLYNFAPINHYTMELGHTWTLALEEQFYLVWPFIIYYIPKKTHLIITLFFLVSLCVAAFYIYPHLEIIKRFRSIRWFLPAVAPILIGSYFAILHHFNFKKIKQLMTSTQWPLVFSGILFLFPLYSPGLTLTLFFQASGSALFLLWILHNQSSSTVRFLEFRFLVYVGIPISYLNSMKTLRIINLYKKLNFAYL